MIFGLACEPKTGAVWLACLQSDLLQLRPHGDKFDPFRLRARSISIRPTPGRVWLTTETDTLWLDDSGRPHIVNRFSTAYGRSWLTAF
jgi:hypothetical protein